MRGAGPLPSPRPTKRAPRVRSVRGKASNKRWLWVLPTVDAIVCVVDPARSAMVPLAHLSGFWLFCIGTLYRLAEDPEDRVKNHGAIRDHLALMRSRAEKERNDLTLPAECRKPAISLLAHWDGLTVFLEHPEGPMDNNASERGILGPAVGRKNFWGGGSEKKNWSAELSVFLYALFATWSLHGLTIRTVLSDYLSVCARRGKAPEDLRPWFPWEMSPDRKAILSRPGPEKEYSG